MIQEINVISTLKKESKTGQPFLALKTNLGNMSCWNANIFNQFINGKKYKVITEQSGNYINILGIESDLGIVPASEFKEPFKEAREDKAHLMLVAYMKDQVVACIDSGATRKVDLDINALWELAYKNITDAYKKLKEEIK